MPAITLGGTDFECTDGGFGEPVLIGEEARSFSGTLRNAVRGEKRTFSGVTAPTEEADWDTLRAAVASRTHVTCSGALLSGDSFSASIRASAKAVPGTSPQRWIISFSGEEA